MQYHSVSARTCKAPGWGSGDIIVRPCKSTLVDVYSVAERAGSGGCHTLLRHAFHTSAMTSTKHRYNDKNETTLTWNGRMCIGTIRDLSLGCGLDRRST